MVVAATAGALRAPAFFSRDSRIIKLHFLLVGLVRDLVRIVLTGLSLLSLHCANIGFGVAAGEQNGCGEQYSQRNFRHRSSSTRLATIHHPAWLWALLLVHRPVEGWGRDLSGSEEQRWAPNNAGLGARRVDVNGYLTKRGEWAAVPPGSG